jgi:3-oxoacyl-[acyl-carrier protein] reductase
MARRFEKKSVLVTGASRGLGRGIAEAFGREGAFVWVHYRDREAEARRTLALVREAGAEGELVRFDLADSQGVRTGLEPVLESRGAPDVLVNNAAVLREGPAATLPFEDFDEVLAVNLSGLFACCQVLARPMIARRAGVIINVASVAAQVPAPGQVAYAASKAGVLALTRNLALELAPKGIRVNAVIPGLFDAGMGERMDRRFAEAMRERIPAGRAGSAAELAAAVLFLASEDASYVHGHALVVDGGFSL